MRASPLANLVLKEKLRLIGGVFLGLAGVAQCSVGSLSPAYAGSSLNFQVKNDQIGGTYFRQSSGNYTVDGSVEPLSGGANGAAFKAQLGSPLRIDSTSTTPPSNNSSTPSEPNPVNCPAPTNFSVTDIQCSRVYKSLIKISGTRDKNTAYILINDDMAGVHLGVNTWDKDVLLQPGVNTITIYGKNLCDAKTPPITIVLTKARMGDTNDDLQTNDYDLSTFTRRWERSRDCLSDFNRDQITNDYDLSLLASSWSG